jgi:hypothetical protein
MPIQSGTAAASGRDKTYYQLQTFDGMKWDKSEARAEKWDLQ